MSGKRSGLRSVVVSADEIPQLDRILSSLGGPLRLVTDKGEELSLPAPLAALLAEGAQLLGEGQSVYLDAMERLLTTQEAADALQISRPFLVRLLDQGEIPFAMVGSHRRVRLLDVLEYKKRRDTHNQAGDASSLGERFLRLIEAIQPTTFVFSVENPFRLLYVSPQIRRLIGHSSQEEFSLEKVKSLISPLDRDDVIAACRRSFATHDPLSIDFRMLTKDGALRWCHAEAVAISDTQKYPRLFQGFLFDITEKKNAELALKESEHKFRSVVEHSKDGIALLDQHGVVVNWNRSMEQISGIPQEDALGKPIWDLQWRLASESAQPLPLETLKQKVLDQISSEPLEALEPPISIELICSHGERRFIDLSLFAFHSGLEQMVGCICREVTDRKRLEYENTRVLDLYLTLFEEFNAMVWRARTDGKCDYFNKVWFAFTGQTHDGAMGDGWIQGIHPDDAEQCLSTYLKAIHFQRPFEMTYRLRRHDGVYRWIRDNGRPFTGIDGQFAGYLGFCYDITDQEGGKP